jgi:XTP/dITP diphosphohydrolase
MDDAAAPRAVLVCASANPHKVAEMEELLAGVVDLWPRPAGLPDVVEDADTLEGNARLKAAAVAAATHRGAVADDTGLEVDALDGAPGVRSHRFAGEHATDADNRALLLARLAGVPDAERTARFHTVVMVCLPAGAEIVTEGVCEGTIAGAERGDGGFGYDPLFVPTDGDGRTFAEMTAVEKHAISHRGRAMRALALNPFWRSENAG